MRLSCFLKFVLPALLAAPLEAAPHSVAFYYGAQEPDAFYSYDWLVTDPANAPRLSGAPSSLKKIAYLSFGEIAGDGASANKNWLLGENKDWNTYAADLRSPGWRARLLSEIEKSSAGYAGYFIDTLDSYQLALSTADWPAYESAAAAFLDGIKAEYPGKILIANRGFEIVDRTARGTIDAVAAESLFSGIDSKTMGYKAVPGKDSDWLKARLSGYVARGIPAIAIDYLPSSEKDAAPALAARIRAAGFIPFVTDITLSEYGVSDLRPVEREVLLVSGGDADIFFSPLHQLAQMPLEYLGLDVRILKEKEIYGLPAGYRPRGIVVWLESSLAREPERFREWITGRLKEGTKVVFINSFGFEPDQDSLKPLGLAAEDNASKYGDPVTILEKDPVADFETKTRPDYDSFLISAEGHPVVTARNSAGQVFTPAAFTAWGGYAFYNSLTRDINGETLWSLNPFEFFKKALQLPDIPAPDMTTENGRRIFFSHIDGDGFIEPCDRRNGRIAAEELRDEVLSRYDLPFSASVIEGEISGHGAYPEGAGRYEAAAVSIFRLPNVEAASHSFSHPFYWGIKTDVSLYKDHNLPIKGYVFDPRREIFGSRDYINSLLPEGKSVKTFFWTGNCLPAESTIRLVKEAGLLNLNGGGATITDSQPWLSRVMPAFLDRHGAAQVYAPMENDNVYNEGWHFPFYRFIQVLQTLELTEKPRRLKPVDIYFHYFSASKQASLSALRRVFDQVLGLKTAQMFASEYVRRALDFKTTYISGAADGSWTIKNNGALRTLRTANALGKPDLRRSRGVAGFKREKDRTYIHLDGSGDYRLYFTSGDPHIPYIAESSALIESFARRGRGFAARLTARGPGGIVVNAARGCRIMLDGKAAPDEILLRKSGEYGLVCECK